MEMANLTMNNVSYLRARDPSILAGNRPAKSQIRTNLLLEMDTQLDEQKESEKILVYLRIKSGYYLEDLYEINGATLTSKIPPGSNLLRNMKSGELMRKSYSFTEIFQPTAKQADIFNSVVKPKLLQFINGQNSTLLTYGASGSGKTFTVIGTDGEPGLIPRSLEYLFRTLPQISKNTIAKPSTAGKVSILTEADCTSEKRLCGALLNASTSLMDKHHHVKTYMAMQKRLSGEPVALLEDSCGLSLSAWVSFAEIYNEQIYDLLQPEPPRGQQRRRLRLGMTHAQPYIKNLTRINVSSGLEAYQILQYGIHNLNYAETNVNAHSSRSHSIFTIHIVQVSERDGGAYVSNFNFCDLAGSERTKKTLNVGDRLKESNNINSSLLVLGRCMAAVRNSQKNNDNKLVPFRESKLTQLFQKALSGLEDIAMIVNISPSREMFDESQHVLNFSAIAKNVSIERPVENVPAKKNNRFSQLMASRGAVVQTSEPEDDVEQLRNAVLYLRDQLEYQRNEFEINDKLNRDHIINGYKDILKDFRVAEAQRVKDIEILARRKYEEKLQKERSRYEHLLEQQKEKQVIVIDSSDDEGENEKTQVKDQQEKIVALQEALALAEFEIESKEQVIKHFKRSNEELQKTLDEGVLEYCSLQERNKRKEDQIIMLKERVADLEIQRNTYRHEVSALWMDRDVASSTEDIAQVVQEEKETETTVVTEKDTLSSTADHLQENNPSFLRKFSLSTLFD